MIFPFRVELRRCCNKRLWWLFHHLRLCGKSLCVSSHLKSLFLSHRLVGAHLPSVALIISYRTALSFFFSCPMAFIVMPNHRLYWGILLHTLLSSRHYQLTNLRQQLFKSTWNGNLFYFRLVTLVEKKVPLVGASLLRNNMHWIITHYKTRNVFSKRFCFPVDLSLKCPLNYRKLKEWVRKPRNNLVFMFLYPLPMSVFFFNEVLV